MKKLLPLLALAIVFNMNAQSWLQTHHLINIPNKPSSASLGDIIAVNGGNKIGNTTLPNAGVIKTLRDFYHMEIDYDYSYFPSEGILNADTCSCANVWCNFGNCSTFINNPGGPSSFASKKGFYCAWNGSGYQFEEVYSTLEAIFPKKSFGGCYSGADVDRSYPNKWYSLTEWGGLPNIQQNFENYLLPYLVTYCPGDTSKPCLIDVLEVGNEPWGNPYPGEAGYHEMLQGAIDVFSNYYGSTNPSDWRMKLSTAALEAHDSMPNNFGATEMYIEDMVPAQYRQYFDYVAIHPYAFPLDNSAFAVNQWPESENGAYLTLKNLVDWRNSQMSHAKVNVTEFGWNAGTPGDGCGPLGESTQASYIMRAFLLALRNDVHRAFVYSISDETEYPLYCTVGLYEDLGANNPRKVMESIIKLKSSTIADKRFLKAITENADQASNGANGVYAYLLGDNSGTPTHLVAWRPDSLGYENSNYPLVSSSYTTITLPDTSLKVQNADNYYYLSWDATQDGLIANNSSTVVNVSGSSSSSVGVKLSAIPIVIPIGNNNCVYDSLGNLNCTGGTTNITQADNNLDFNLYPNPAANAIYFQLEGISNQNIDYEIYNVSGNLIKSGMIKAGKGQISLDSYKNGSYLFKIISANKKQLTKRFTVLK